jgi:tryptophan-rich sensory protein
LSLYSAWINIKDKKKKQKIFILFGINFLLNILWSLFYFTLENPLLAFFDLILLWVSIFILIKISWKENRKTSWLLFPYILWISFAGILNYLSI